DRTTLAATISGLSIPTSTPFWIRWNDPNASGADDGLGVDDFSLTPQGAVPTVTPTVTDTPGGPTATQPSTPTQTGTPTVTPTLLPGNTIMQIQGQAHLAPL